VTGHEFLGEQFRSPAGADLSDHEPLHVTFAWDLTPSE
jgi:hypothetical protein